MSDKLSKRAQSTQLQNLLIVDPNPCGSSVINVEDLSISVELEVFRRSDDIIIFDNTTANTTQQENGTLSETTRISFIDGSGEEQKSLTTSYTDLNTRFVNSQPELQTLGIETIDITFNTSYTPIVKIKFKDIRGKLFEMGPNSPYGFLFRMPYPIFYLTIKGYYGKPVTYPLHLLKFNGALDGETGSFIITCEFIGYTYAFLSDLLMGYLRAIPYTTRGESLINKEFDNFVRYDQLSNTISELNKFVSKFKENDEKLKALTIYQDLAEKLDKISGIVKGQITTLEKRRTVVGSDLVVYSDEPITQNFIRNWSNTVLSLVDEYNDFTKQIKGSTFELDKSDFILDNSGVYIEGFKTRSFYDTVNGEIDRRFVRFKSFNSFQQNSQVVKKKYERFIETGNEEKDKLIESNYDEFIKILKQSPFQSLPTATPSGKDFNLIDVRLIIKKIDILRDQINEELISNKNLVTNDFLGKLSDFFNEQGIGFDGSIGSFFRIICRHVDLFVSVLRDLGTSIKMDYDKGDRTIQNSNKENFTEFEDDNSSTIKIKAFPEYVEKEDGALVEKWLGSNPKFSDFKEVLFVDDFLNSLLKRAQKDQEFLDNVSKNSKGWYPVNPLETVAADSTNINPWLIPNNETEIFLAKLLFQRMVLFLGYTNSNITDEEINQMAKIEARQMYKAILNNLVRKSIVTDNTEIIGTNGKINQWRKQLSDNFSQNLKNVDGKLYYYHQNFEYSDNQLEEGVNVYIPIQQDLTSIKSSFNLLGNLEYRISETKPFVSSVVSNIPEVEGSPETEEETFIKIITSNEYNKTFIYDYDSDLDINPVTKSFKNKDVNILNINKPYGGKYRTHEFLNYEHNVAGNIPLFLDFYEGGNDIVNGFRTINEFEYDTFIESNDTFIYQPDARKFENDVDKENLANIYDKSTLKDKIITNYKNQKPNDRTYKFQPTFKSDNKVFNLFGSEFYYRQSVYGRALLFLHTIPFRGMGGKGIGLLERDTDKGLLQGKDIKYFNERGGFVSVPYVWVLFLGALLYREKNENDILVFGDNSNSFIPRINEVIEVPKNAYLIGRNNRTEIQGLNLEFINSFSDITNYDIEYNNIIQKLPDSVKNEFILQFESFVNNDWEILRARLEIFADTATPAQRLSAWENLGNQLNTGVIRNDVPSNYFIVSPEKEKSNFILDLRDGSDAQLELIDLLFDKRIIINSTYRIWQGLESRYAPISFPETQAVNYLETFFNEFKQLNTTEVIDPIEERKKTLFNTNNDDDIKLSIYKNLKSIYDKWIVGIPKNQKGTVTNNLYDKFSFLDRAYVDISEKFKVAPTTFVNYWKDNTNISFYNFIARVLRDNNFDFIPLPTYINYSDKEDVRNIFEPFRFNEVEPTRGPQFICMYFGEQSNKLDIDKTSKFKKNDTWSIDVKCNGDNITVNNSSELPDDFVSGSTKVPYFLVNYADQNQSLFKTFNLDQSEFTETQESLEIIDAISNQNRNNSIGQNLFDIYNNRAYSCEVEMLGCAQIQPFMYFQLNNVPMFDGAYNIINTRHSIKANHMTTWFKGVRIRAVKTKMIDDRTLYTHLINNLNEVSKEGATLSSINKETVGNIKSSNIEPAITNDGTPNETEIINGIIVIE
jgi:hypothetical protein